jgi:Fe-S-cluster containining protein
MNIMQKEGFDFGFDPNACESCPGYCCRGQSGNIWVNYEDILSMCRFLQTTPIDFIKERVGEHDLECVFFDSLQKCCSIYTVRPRQCRTFPFWEHFKRNKDELIKECPGVKL